MLTPDIGGFIFFVIEDRCTISSNWQHFQAELRDSLRLAQVRSGCPPSAELLLSHFTMRNSDGIRGPLPFWGKQQIRPTVEDRGV